MTTVGDCWRNYESLHLPQTVNPRAQSRYWGRLEMLSAVDVNGCSPLEVEAYVEERQREGALPGTINRELALLRACLRHAERHGLIEKAPIIRALPKPPPKMTVLTRKEATSLVRAADKGNWRERVYIRLALGTGQRSGAIMDLQWEGVNHSHGVIDFRLYGDDKSARMKRRAVVPINDMVTKALKIAKAHEDGPYVLHWHGQKLQTPRDIMARIAERAGLPQATPHVLRHTVASILLQEGQDLLHVSRLLGHASTVITQQVYFQHPPSWLRSTTDLLKF